MNSTFIAVAIMLILAACMFYGQTLYKKHKVEWGKALTIICGIIIISTAIWLNFIRSEVDMKAIEREKLYQQAQALILANTLTNMYAGGSGKCLLLHHPTDTRNRVELDRLAEVFTRGFGGKVTEMRTVPIKDYVLSDEMSEEAMMESTAEDFNKVLAANADCDIVILMVPLPYSKEELNGIDILRMIPDADDPSKLKKDPSIKYPLVGIFNG
jgi:hypothetical protein